MATERKWDAVPPQFFSVNGTNLGLITLADTAGFKVKQTAYIKSQIFPNLPVQIKRVLSPTQLVVGLVDNKIASWKALDISKYTLSIGAAIGAEEQNKNNIPSDDHYSAIYESDPIVGDRVISVDQYGQFFTPNNPAPVALFGTQITILNNLLAMQVGGVSPGTYLVNNEGFFIFDNEGNFIKAT